MSKNDNVWHTIVCPYCDHKHEWLNGEDDLLRVHTLHTQTKDSPKRDIQLSLCNKCDAIILVCVVDEHGGQYYEPLTKEV